MVAEWGPLFRRRVIQPGFSAHFFCNAKCYRPSCTLLQCLTAIVINSWDICIPSHPFLHCMLIFWTFGSLPSQSEVPDSLLRFCSQGGFFTVFPAHFFCSALCHPSACAAVSATHSDQLLRTLHSTHPFLHYMLIFCSFCCLPSQSQRSDSLLRLWLEALFGAQSRVVLPRRGCFQALLSGCTILPIISCSIFALSNIFRWRSTWMGQGAHREGCWFGICLACPKVASKKRLPPAAPPHACVMHCMHPPTPSHPSCHFCLQALSRKGE